MGRDQVLEAIRAILVELGADMGLSAAEISLETSLLDDVGLDSLKFVDLTVALEEALGIDEFPMQSWADRERERGDRPFTVGALLDECSRVLALGDPSAEASRSARA